jgi:hypothetical protein
LLKRRREDGEEHEDVSQGAHKGDNIHDGEEQEEGRMKENWMTPLIVTSWDSVRSRENNSGDKDCDRSARLRGLFYPPFCLLKKLNMLLFEELVCSLTRIVAMHDIMGGNYLSHTLHGNIVLD